MTFLKLASVGKKRNGSWVLRDISFSLARGEILAVIGHSGSGKSTLLKCINRLIDVDDGKIIYNSKDIYKLDPPELRKKIGMVFQFPAVFPGTVRENVEYGLNIWNENGIEGKVTRAMSDAGLSLEFLDRNGEELSGGEQQRVCLARTLALNSDILLLDEPTSSLDNKSALKIEKTILQLREKRNLSILWVTHDLEQARRVAEKTLVLDAGKLKAIGKISEIDWGDVSG